MDAPRLRLWWWRRQGLDGSLAGVAPAHILDRAGWARSVGGSAPYLTLWSRGGWSREGVDGNSSIFELPSARACTYVVPAADSALALQAARPFADADLKTALKLGVTDAEIERLCSAVLDALREGPLDPEGIRQRVGGAARNLGPEGVKKGVATTLPVALGKLQFAGDIRRSPANGRLDGQRYRYMRWEPNPLQGAQLSDAEVAAALARRYFRWIGPATAAEFQWFSGLGAKAARAAVGPLGLTALPGTDRLLFPDDLDALMSLDVRSEPQYALVSSLDSMVLLRRDFAQLLDAADTLHLAGGLSDLPSHPILDRGRIVGLWEYDPEAASIAWHSFVPADDALLSAVDSAEQFAREQLGDVRSFSLDSPKKRRPRIEALRARAASRA